MTKIVSKTIVENKKYFWRDVTPAQVEACIKGSLLGSIYDYLQKNYTPKAPCSMILVQSLVLMACAMTHLREDLPDDDGNALETTDLEAEMQRDAFCVKSNTRPPICHQPINPVFASGQEPETFRTFMHWLWHPPVQGKDLG